MSRPLTTDTKHRRVGVRHLGRVRRSLLALLALAATISFTPSEAQIIRTESGTLPTPKPEGRNGISDPLEDLNRPLFQFNLTLDDIILKPSARAYRWAVPKAGRRSVSNFLSNVSAPTIFANDLLQGEIGRAATTTARFGINSTVGLAGFFDPARSVGLMRHSEDFGQTLGVWGVGPGPYLMLPLLGPSNPRDGVGTLVDQVFDPLTWTGGDWVVYAQLGLLAVNQVSQREAIMDQFDEIERTSIDFYAAVRSMYYQSRQNDIKNGKSDFSDLPDLSEFDVK